jgi:glycosyltransferase involved in cell wall biosynthesis
MKDWSSNNLAMEQFNNLPRIALAHDSFTQLGGAERVIEGLHELYPEAPVFTLVLDKKLHDKYRGWDIRASWLQVLYNFIPKLQYLLPLIPAAVSSLDFSGYDLVLSTSSGFIKNIRAPKNSAHIDYCHTPARFLWTDKDYVHAEVPAFLRPLVNLFLKRMRRWDYQGAQRVDFFIANSAEVQKRVRDIYQRTSTIVHAFVDTSFWRPTKSKGDYFLIAGRLQAHKNNELVIRVFNEIKLPLHVVGVGRQEDYLKSMSKPNIFFLGQLSDEALRDEYSGASGFIYPQVEDFGLMPLEAAACGTPTLAYAKGGALETVVPGVTGELFYDYDQNIIKKQIFSWDYSKYRTGDLRAQAEKFSKEKFKDKITNIIRDRGLLQQKHSDENRD